MVKGQLLGIPNWLKKWLDEKKADKKYFDSIDTNTRMKATSPNGTPQMLQLDSSDIRPIARIYNNPKKDGVTWEYHELGFAPTVNNIVRFAYTNTEQTSNMGEMFPYATMLMCTLWNGKESSQSILYNPTMVPMVHFPIGACISVEHGDNWAQFIRVSEYEVKIITSSEGIYGLLYGYL